MIDKCIDCGSRDSRENGLYEDPEGEYICGGCAASRLTTLTQRINELEFQLKDWKDSYQKVLNDEGAEEEKHCLCVAPLRMRITELEEERERLNSVAVFPLEASEAEKLARNSSYADLAVEYEDTGINWADAGAFFIEGYLHAFGKLRSALTTNSKGE